MEVRGGVAGSSDLPFNTSSCCEDGPEDVSGDDFAKLLKIFQSLEDETSAGEKNDFTALSSWLSKNGANNDIVLPGRAKSALPDNRGSPLLVACELDFPASAKALLAHGADVNYTHPASHGACPLLRCAEMGYDECLAVLLEEEGLDVTAVTKEYKLVLGQSIPQYEAGGRNALLLAIEACRLGAVQLLLGHQRAVEALLRAPDSFGRTPLQAATEKAAMKESGSLAATMTMNIALAIYRATLSSAPDDARLDADVKALIPTKNDAVASWRMRNVVSKMFLLFLTD